jgi:hypothetical protein
MAREKKVEPETVAPETPASEPVVATVDEPGDSAQSSRLDSPPETFEGGSAAAPARRMSGKKLEAAQRQERRERREKRLKERGY